MYIDRRKDELRHRGRRLENLGKYHQAAEVWTSYLKVAPDEASETRAKIARLQELAKQAAEEPRKRSPLLRVMIVAVIVVLFGAIGWLLALPSSPLRVALAGPTATPTHTLTPTATRTLPPDLDPTATLTEIPPTPQPTAIPLKWERLNSGTFLRQG